MEQIYEINKINLEEIRKKRRRVLINRVKNKENLNYLDYKYHEIMKDWIVLKTTMDFKKNLS
jgi:hypothetical protein